MVRASFKLLVSVGSLSDIKKGERDIARYVPFPFYRIVRRKHYTVRMSFDLSSTKSSIFLMYLSVSF